MSSEDIKTLDELIECLDNRGQFPLLSQELFMINITWNKRLEKLEAENKRLRDALNSYSFYAEPHEIDTYISVRVDIHERAQEALKGE